jgi:nucleoside-diphosphate-sugar epimerase
MVVSVLGCGWLGKALADYLVEKRYDVKGSVTREEKLKELNSAGIKSFLVKLNGAALDDTSDFWNCDALVISSNVNLQGNPEYINGLKAVARIIALKKTKRVIVISSTSVYGEPCHIVDESSVPCPKTPSAECLLEIERLFQNISGSRATVMRCGGLLGPGRMPGSFLAGKQNISNGLAPVNLVHQSDCIGIIECLLNTVEKVDCINAVAPDHPSRFQFYTTAARVQGLPLPGFILEKTSWKVVLSKRAKALGYQYQVDSWESWLS